MIKLKIKYGNSQTDIRFPCTEKALQEALAEIGAEQVRPLELYVTEVVFPEELAFLQDRFVNLDEVNFLGKRMDSFFGDEEYQFYEAMKLEGFDTLPDLINLSFNLNRYPLIRDIGDMGKIGREYLLTVNGCIPAHDEDDPKYAQLGRELIQSGNGIFTEHGMLFVDENTPFQRSYDGQTFPAYLYDPGVLCVAKAEYGGKTEYLYFPCEEEAIDKAFARLGTTADEVKITLEDFNTDSPEWFGRFREIAAEEGVYELNRLTGAVNTADMDLKKLWSVAEYAEAEDAEQLTRLARNIGCFTFIEGATSYAEVGRFFTETEDRYILDLEMEDYFDYEGFGEYISDKFYGKFVCGGFIYNDTDTSLLDILALPIKVDTKSGFQLAHPGDSIDLAYPTMNTRRGRVGEKIAHTVTPGNTQGCFFIDMNAGAKLTETARCITARQDSGISKHKGEHSAVFIEDEPRAVVTPDKKTIRQQGRWIKEPNEPMFTLTVQDRHGILRYGRVRKLTPRECWRLQGFTDEQFDKAKAAGLSDGRLYKMAGNAVSVPVVSAVGAVIKRIYQEQIQKG